MAFVCFYFLEFLSKSKVCIKWIWEFATHRSDVWRQDLRTGHVWSACFGSLPEMFVWGKWQRMCKVYTHDSKKGTLIILNHPMAQVNTRCKGVKGLNERKLWFIGGVSFLKLIWVKTRFQTPFIYSNSWTFWDQTNLLEHSDALIWKGANGPWSKKALSLVKCMFTPGFLVSSTAFSHLSTDNTNFPTCSNLMRLNDPTVSQEFQNSLLKINKVQHSSTNLKTFNQP